MAAAAVEGWLPEELLTLILSKLPVKSLLRCKCVRKSWYSLINSPHFIHLHRSSSSSSSNCFIVKGCIKQPQDVNVLSFFSYDLDNDISKLISDRDDWDIVSVSGPSDGLICLTNLSDQILICNPAMRELRSIFLPPSSCERPGYRSIDSVAFGSDPNTAGGQYKLLMISSMLTHVFLGVNPEVQMYDFRTDSWRETRKRVVIPSPFLYSYSAILLNGAFHWCPTDVDSNILTFHINDEVTGSIPLPRDFMNIYLHYDLFVSSKFELALFLYDTSGPFEICVMTEYGVKESWTRLLRIEIGPLSDSYYPRALWGEHLLLLGTRDSKLASYDLQRQNIRVFPMYGDVIDAYPYSESLVSVHGIGGES